MQSCITLFCYNFVNGTNLLVSLILPHHFQKSSACLKTKSPVRDEDYVMSEVSARDNSGEWGRLRLRGAEGNRRMAALLRPEPGLRHYPRRFQIMIHMIQCLTLQGPYKTIPSHKPGSQGSLCPLKLNSVHNEPPWSLVGRFLSLSI